MACKSFVAFLLFVSLAGSALPVRARQGLPEAKVRFTTVSLVYTAASTESGWLEYVGAGYEAIAAGRNGAGTWVEVNLDGQLVGWVPVEVVSFFEGVPLNELVVRGGLFPTGTGKYAASDPRLRQVEVEMIRVGRMLRGTWARWNRLQAFQDSNCSNLPDIPTRPVIPQNLVDQIPELERVRHELFYVYDEARLALLIFAQVCNPTDDVNIDVDSYNRGIRHINPAYGAYDIIRKYLNELTGLAYRVE